jgi:uncharacterized protein (DUF302 family)
MDYSKTIKLNVGFAQAVPKVKEAFAAQGFGVLTEIDVQTTLKTKLGAEMEPYLIIGACNPQLAHVALDLTRDVGLLLPCNVVVRSEGDAVIVQALDPAVITAVADNPALQPIADEAGRRIEAALSSLAAGH